MTTAPPAPPSERQRLADWSKPAWPQRPRVEIMRPLRSLVVALGIHRDTVRRWARDGKLPGAARKGRNWRVPQSTIDALLTGELVIDPAVPE